MIRPLIITLFHLPLWLVAQNCCTATTEFTQLSDDLAFQIAHEEPIPFDFEPAGADIVFPVKGGDPANGYIIRAAKPTKNYLFVIHEWWGLNDHIKQTADKLHSELDNVTVLCLDLYDGHVTDKRDEASKLMQAADEDRIRSIIDGARDYVGPNVNIGTIGWCFGGGWSLQATLQLEDQAAGCVIYYGMPEKDVERLKTLTVPVLGIFATKDGWVTPSIVKDFENTMLGLNKAIDIAVFEAEHAFANPSNPQYDKRATKEAWQMTIGFLSAMLMD